MTKEEQKQISTAGVKVLSSQENGKYWLMGQGLVDTHKNQEPYRILDDAPIFHFFENYREIEVPPFIREKVHKWGQYYQQHIGLSEFGGMKKYYVDTRVKGWYVLWEGLKADEWAWGPTDWDWEIIAWTPRKKSDNLMMAGYRMFYAHAQFMCDQGVIVSSDDSFNPDDWYLSLTCKIVSAAMTERHFCSEEEFQYVYEQAPEMFKAQILQNKIKYDNS